MKISCSHSSNLYLDDINLGQDKKIWKILTQRILDHD